jgi:uncharacterized repeat protein (TIGR03803 family)
MRLRLYLLIAVGALTSVASPAAASYRVLHQFTGGSDGGIPWAGLVAGKKGNFYGTTSAGGPYTVCSGGEGCGTIFTINAKGQESVLYVFTGSTDGGYPTASLIRDKAGNLYGTTREGGDPACECGTVFKLSPGGVETVLHAFAGGSDGSAPWAGLIADDKGNLYGTTSAGGSTDCHDYGCGTVFKVATDGTESVLYAFTGGVDGGFPTGSLLLDQQGNLYGTTQGGGTGAGDGAVFRLTPGGTESVLHSFAGGDDGFDPESGLVADAHGNFYGTTELGGGTGCGGNGCGTVFEVAANGTESVLHAFAGGSDGEFPFAALIVGKKGDLYGTATGGGTDDFGIVFKLASGGKETVLHAFGTTQNDGTDPTGALILDGHFLYGTTENVSFSCNGGACGTVFRVKE